MRAEMAVFCPSIEAASCAFAASAAAPRVSGTWPEAKPTAASRRSATPPKKPSMRAVALPRSAAAASLSSRTSAKRMPLRRPAMRAPAPASAADEVP